MKKKWRLTQLLKSIIYKHYLLTINTKFIIVFNGSMLITSLVCNQHIYIYTGTLFQSLYILHFMVNFRLGNFIQTRKPFKFLKTNKLTKR